MRRLLNIFKGLYDLVASYLLAWVLLLGLLALGFHLVLWGVAALSGFQSVESLWAWVDRVSPVGSVGPRLVLFGTLHLLTIWLLRRRLLRLWLALERGADRLLTRWRRWARAHHRGRVALGALFSIVVTLLLVPFVVQPTLVPLQLGGRAWAERGANLVDGSASAALIESVVGLYRRVYARPVPGPGVSAEEFDGSFGKGRRRRPLMDRWDPLIARVVGGDSRDFARLKAVMWVESAGEQYAVSGTGCVGLMQFCTRTGRSAPYRAIFGVGQVYPCRCSGPCQVSLRARRELESGDARRVVAASFPCELTDARFDPHKSLTAGWRFLDDLGQELGGNLALTYVGYNSGPFVARRLWRAVGQRGDADLQLIARHLPAALRPYYGAAAEARARSLARIHLPKLLHAYRRYLRRRGP